MKVDVSAEEYELILRIREADQLLAATELELAEERFYKAMTGECADCCASGNKWRAQGDDGTWTCMASGEPCPGDARFVKDAAIMSPPLSACYSDSGCCGYYQAGEMVWCDRWDGPCFNWRATA